LKPNKVLGRSVSRRRKPEEGFSEDEVLANQNYFEEIENLLHLETPSTSFREKLITLIGECRAVKGMWAEAPRRKAIHAELKSLQTAFRRNPDNIQDHLSHLSPEALFQVEAKGLTEDISPNNVKKVIQSAIHDVPKDTGGVPADQGLRFLAMRYGALYKEHTGTFPTATYESTKKPKSASFLRSLLIVDSLTWPLNYAQLNDDEAEAQEIRMSALEDICKTLFYRRK
jgi:hypothetical protein